MLKLHWLHEKDQCITDLIYMASSMTSTLDLYTAIDHTIVGSMIGRRAYRMDVSFGGEDPHTFCKACSKGSMRDDVATTVQHLFLLEVSHESDEESYDVVYLLPITKKSHWARLIHNGGGKIFGDPNFILPFEGNISTAQEQPSLYTVHKWRGEQRGVGYDAYHFQIFSPPSLLELKVEEDVQQLPYLEVTRFLWMIAWGHGGFT